MRATANRLSLGLVVGLSALSSAAPIPEPLPLPDPAPAPGFGPSASGPIAGGGPPISYFSLRKGKKGPRGLDDDEGQEGQGLGEASAESRRPGTSPPVPMEDVDPAYLSLSSSLEEISLLTQSEAGNYHPEVMKELD